MLAPTGRIAASGVILSLTLGLTSCEGLPQESSPKSPTATPSPLQILEGVRQELIPAEGSETGYGPDFSSYGYEMLRQWNTDIRPAAVWVDDYVRLDIRLPCCGAVQPYEDETKNCGCGHHQAIYGLAKRLLKNGDRLPQVQAEIGRWRAFMFPRETLQAEMERRALNDPAIRQALDELRQQGIC